MSVVFAKLALAAMAALMIATLAAYGGTLLYVCMRFRRGTLLFVGKSLGIALITVPLAILLVLWGVLAAISWTASRARAKWWRWRGVAEDEASPVDLQADDVVVHLIHGTFESDAAWTLPSSPLCQEILAQNPAVKFNRFVWTGFNTQKARRDAAKAFAQVLKSSASQHHYVVAHSHGGNIVKQVSHDEPALKGKVKGVCLLSPPFIYRRRIKRVASRFVLSHSLGFVIMAQLPAAALLMPWGFYNTSIAFAVAIAVVLWESRWARRFQAQLDEELKSEGEMHFDNLKILHAIGDEADSVLRFTSFLHEACLGLLSQLQATAKQLTPSWGPVVLSTLGIACGALWVWRSGDEQMWVWIGAMALAAAAIIGHAVFKRVAKIEDEHDLLYMAASPVALLSVWLGAVKSLAYGDWRLLFCPDIFVCTSETPAGEHAVVKYAPSDDGALVHSTHANSEAIQDTAAWLRASLQRP